MYIWTGYIGALCIGDSDCDKASSITYIILTFYSYSTCHALHFPCSISATSAVQQFYKISASTGGNENAVCPQDTLIYYCNIVPSTAKGTTVWAIYMANLSIDSGEILELMQAEFLGCAHETVIDKTGFFIAMNGDSSGRICVNSNLTVIANMSLNGKRVSCVNVGGAYLNVEGSTNIYVAGTNSNLLSFA